MLKLFDEIIDKKLLAKNVLDSYLQQLFIDGFFHGDPHPGNIMILDNNVLCYLDLGMMGFFDEEFKKKFLRLLKKKKRMMYLSAIRRPTPTARERRTAL